MTELIPLTTPSLTGTAEGDNPPAQGWGSGGHSGAQLPPQAPVPAAVPACLSWGGRRSVKRYGHTLPCERDPFSLRYQCGFSPLPPSVPDTKGFYYANPSTCPCRGQQEGYGGGGGTVPYVFPCPGLGVFPLTHLEPRTYALFRS